MIDNNKPYFLYGSKNTGKKDKEVRRVTIAGIVVNDELLIGRAECSAKDQFTKKKGRAIASGRALKHPIEKVVLNESQIIGKIFVEVATQLI